MPDDRDIHLQSPTEGQRPNKKRSSFSWSINMNRLRLGDKAETSGHFAYHPLAYYGASHDFRLLRVLKTGPTSPVSAGAKAEGSWSYEIVHFDTECAPAYEAVSYVWGSSVRSCLLTLSNGKTLRITESVNEFLPFLSATCQTGYLWIDQICVNQDDLIERSKQVANMGKIFSTAHRTLAWLGESNESNALRRLFSTVEQERVKEYGEAKERAFGTMPASNYKSISSLIAVDGKPSEELLGLVSILKRPWYSRAWIFQEVVLSSNLILIIGGIEITLLTLAEAVHACFLDLDRSSGRSYVVSISHCRDIQELAERICKSSEEKQQEAFSCLLDKLGGKQTSDARDHVYAYLGFLSDSSISILPDYNSSIESTFIQCTRAIINGTHSLDIMGTIRLPGHFSGTENQLPTWVPDWSSSFRYHQLGRKATRRQEPNAFNASRGQAYYYDAEASPQRPEKLELKGIVVGTIENTVKRVYTSNIVGLDQQIIGRLQIGRVRSELVEKLQSSKLDPNSITQERVLRVLLADGALGEDQPLDQLKIAKFLRLYKKIQLSTADISSPSFQELELYSKVSLNRRVCSTTTGDLCLASTEVKPGDFIIIAQGCRTPLVLRGGYYSPDKKELCTILVGECYLEGAMYGERYFVEEQHLQTYKVF
jgi:hypothetical protein